MELKAVFLSDSRTFRAMLARSEAMTRIPVILLCYRNRLTRAPEPAYYDNQVVVIS